MAINKPRIAGQPAVERSRIKDQPFKPHGAGPNDTHTEIVNTVPTVVGPITPDREGQMYFYPSMDDTGLNRTCEIYVAVDIGGTLEWKRVAPVPDIVDRYTGRPVDAIYD